VETKDGRSIPYFWTGISATIEGTPFIVGMGTDLSQLRETEDALHDSEVLYRMLAERIPIGAMLYQNSKIIFANDAFVSIFGIRDKYQILEKDIDQIFSKGYETYFRQTFESLERGMSRDRPIETCCLTRDGREIWIEGQATLIRWQHQPTVFVTVRDTTEDRHRERSMQEEKEHLRRENVSLRSSLKDRYRLGSIVGKSSAMQDVYELISNAAATSASVFIYGESGTGKELVARAIHDMSNRSGKEFVPVNCAAIPENLLESEFFGHRKGAFTGAHADKKGYLDLANGGTLFLDELGDLNLTLQAKLLRAIEGGGYTPVGDNQTRHSDFRVIAATNRNAWRDVKKGIIREDFFYRLHVIPIKIPPLRKRKEDIPLLMEHFLKLQTDDKKMPRIPGHVIEMLMSYEWPGNVRELQNAIQRYLVVGRIEFIPGESFETADPNRPPPEPEGHDEGEEALRLSESMEEAERAVIRKALDQHQGNKTLAAEALGISRRTLSRKLNRLGVVWNPKQ
jgi:PAS domain S-box-containing protein